MSENYLVQEYHNHLKITPIQQFVNKNIKVSQKQVQKPSYFVDDLQQKEKQIIGSIQNMLEMGNDKIAIQKQLLYNTKELSNIEENRHKPVVGRIIHNMNIITAAAEQSLQRIWNIKKEINDQPTVIYEVEPTIEKTYTLEQLQNWSGQKQRTIDNNPADQNNFFPNNFEKTPARAMEKDQEIDEQFQSPWKQLIEEARVIIDEVKEIQPMTASLEKKEGYFLKIPDHEENSDSFNLYTKSLINLKETPENLQKTPGDRIILLPADGSQGILLNDTAIQQLSNQISQQELSVKEIEMHSKKKDVIVNTFEVPQQITDNSGKILTPAIKGMVFKQSNTDSSESSSSGSRSDERKKNKVTFSKDTYRKKSRKEREASKKFKRKIKAKNWIIMARKRMRSYKDSQTTINSTAYEKLLKKRKRKDRKRSRRRRYRSSAEAQQEINRIQQKQQQAMKKSQKSVERFSIDKRSSSSKSPRKSSPRKLSPFDEGNKTSTSKIRSLNKKKSIKDIISGGPETKTKSSRVIYERSQKQRRARQRARRRAKRKEKRSSRSRSGRRKRRY